MRIVDASLDEFRRKVLEAGVSVRVIRTTVPGYRTVGNRAVAVLAVVVDYLADIVGPDGLVETWNTTEHRLVSDRGEFDLTGALYESLPNITFVRRTGTF